MLTSVENKTLYLKNGCHEAEITILRVL